MSIRMLLVDDDEIIRKRMKRGLEDHLNICGEASNGRDAIAKVLELKPDLVLMDVSMPVMNGIEATRKIRESGLAAKILMLLTPNSGETAELAMEAGADGGLSKMTSIDQMLKRIETMLGGKV